jgi:predicted TPR repeat methyltransferase
LNKKISDIYDKEYFEDGLITGKSCYQNYRWLPELTIKMAYNFIKYLKINDSDKVLDFGCAKGYLVKALRILDVNAYGCDISEYAIDMLDPAVHKYCKLIKDELPSIFEMEFDWIISKDVFEHMDNESVDIFLKGACQLTDRMFHVIPLGENGKYRVPNYNEDPSHIQINDEKWWTNKFESNGWKVKEFKYAVRGIKENWTEKYEQGNGFFVLEKD